MCGKRMFIIAVFIISFAPVHFLRPPYSDILLSEPGYSFAPIDSADWLDDFFIGSFQNCVFRCNEEFLCRSFDYNTVLYECRLFQVAPLEIQIAYQASSISQMGIVQQYPELYTAYNQTCNLCDNDRYLICNQGYCDCPLNAYWDGSICQQQKYAGELCDQSSQCRSYPFNITCNQMPICSINGYSPYICSQNRVSTAFRVVNSSAYVYRQSNFLFVAQTTSLVVQFTLESQNGFWLVDNISLIDVSQNFNIIQNGDFEIGNLSSWNYCNPSATLNGSRLGQNSGSLVAQSGNFFYYGAPHPQADYLGQTVSTTIGTLYRLYFWSAFTSNNSVNSMTVTIFS